MLHSIAPYFPPASSAKLSTADHATERASYDQIGMLNADPSQSETNNPGISAQDRRMTAFITDYLFNI